MSPIGFGENAGSQCVVAVEVGRSFVVDFRPPSGFSGGTCVRLLHGTERSSCCPMCDRTEKDRRDSVQPAPGRASSGLKH